MTCLYVVTVYLPRNSAADIEGFIPLSGLELFVHPMFSSWEFEYGIIVAPNRMYCQEKLFQYPEKNADPNIMLR